MQPSLYLCDPRKIIALTGIRAADFRLASRQATGASGFQTTALKSLTY